MTGQAASPRLILVGRILAPYGVKGWVKIEPYTESPESLRKLAGQWHVGRDDPGAHWPRVEVAENALHSGNIVARFAGCEDRDAALKYRGMNLAVPRSVLPDTREGEFYQADLLGLRVVNEQEQELGKVSGLFSNGGHEVLRVRYEKDEKDEKGGGHGERLLPFVPTVVKAVDLESGLIRVDWGLDW
jgi:16S rRNA processing protein RimM